MKKTQRLHLISLIFNVAIIGFMIAGIALLRVKNEDLAGGKIFLLYPVVCGCITLLSSLLMVFANAISIKRGKDATPKFFFNLRFISAVMSLVTLGLAIYSLIGNTLEFKAGEKFALATLYFVVPGISILEFIGTQLEPECKFRKTFVPFLFTLLYVVAVVCVITFAAMIGGAKFAEGSQEFKDFINSYIPYDFFRLSPKIIFVDGGADAIMAALKTNIITLLIVIVSSYAISFIVWSLNRIVSSIVVGVSYHKEEEGKPKVQVKEKVGVRIKRSFSTHEHDKEDNSKVYHISYANRRKKTWKVKGELADRANKIFNTQREAIDFANELVAKNGGSIRIHSMVGRIRKDW